MKGINTPVDMIPLSSFQNAVFDVLCSDGNGGPAVTVTCP